jgi:hypothetical protein
MIESPKSIYTSYKYRLSYEGRGDIYDIVLKAIRLISPHPDYDNLFVTYLYLYQGQNLFLK